MMKNKELTPWFPPHIKPVRPGVYIASVAKQEFYRRWTGKYWCYGAYDIALARTLKRKWPDNFPPNWRGLNEDPSKKGGAT
jgi:hypothetical protein